MAVVVLLLLGLGRALLVRQANADMLATRAAENAILQVRVVQPSASGYESKLTLPGTLQGIYEAQIYARTNGYVKQWFKDIGQPVKKGELLATLDIPDVNKQVEEAKANFELAKIAYERWSRVCASMMRFRSRNMTRKLAAYQQTEAVLKRLRDQQDFGKVLAPFDGIVTRRNVDNGDLMNAGNGGTGQTHVRHRADRQAAPLCLCAAGSCGAEYASATAWIFCEQRPPTSRPRGGSCALRGRSTRAHERCKSKFRCPIADHSLLPGAYVDVALTLKSDGGLILPTNALLFNSAGSRVAIVQPDGKVKMQAVALGTDFGHEVEIKKGLKPDDKVIMNPPDSISDGQAVAIAAEADKGKLTAMRRILLLVGLPLLCAACAPIGPDYSRPAITDMPAGMEDRAGLAAGHSR